MNLIGRFENSYRELGSILNEMKQEFVGGSRSVTSTISTTRRRRASNRATGQGNNNVTQIPSGTNRTRHLTAAARRKMSLAAKKRWAEKKAA